MLWRSQERAMGSPAIANKGFGTVRELFRNNYLHQNTGIYHQSMIHGALERSSRA